MSADILMAFTLAATVLAFVPGPDNIFVLTQSALNGVRAGIAITFGLASGLVFHTAAVVLGLAALLQVSVIAFTALKLLGAGYLLYLAWGAWRAPGEEIDGEATKLSAFGYYRRGIIMNVTNPKVTIFFLAFLPQFVEPASGSFIGQLLVLAFIFMLVTLVVFSCIALASGWLGGRLSGNPGAQRVMNRIAAVIFIMLAGRLLFMAP
jgi:threonine/homoserine/homoserine lactone efflux protein